MSSSRPTDDPERPSASSPDAGDQGTSDAGADSETRKRLEEAAAALAAGSRAVHRGGTPVPTPTSDPYIGRVLDGRYRIEERLGSGGMGAVFSGEHLSLRKKVAIKVIKSDLAGNHDIASRFAREALASARIEHHHVATALDSGTMPEGGAYLVMQLVRGRSLRAHLGERGKLPWADVCQIGAQVADALAAAHREGIVHRDLKPENLLLEDRDDGLIDVRVVDFGIARMNVDGKSAQITVAKTLTRAGTVVGTPGYMAPEQAMGEAVDERADLYALGVIIWELATGKDPFRRREREVASLIRAQLIEQPTPPDPAAVPPPLEGLLRALLRPERRSRPQTAVEVRDAFRQMVGAPPGPALSGATVAAGTGSTSISNRAAMSRADVEAPAPAARSIVESLPSPPRLSAKAVAGLAALGFVVLVGGGILAARLVAGLGAGAGDGDATAGVLLPAGGAGASGLEQGVETPPALGPDDIPPAEPADPDLPPLVRDRIAAMMESDKWIDRERAARWLSDYAADEASPVALPDWVRAVATFELSRGCRAREDAIDDILRAGDARALPSLERIADAPRVGCGDSGRDDCHGCIRADLERAVRVLRPDVP